MSTATIETKAMVPASEAFHWDREQIDLLKRTICREASDDEFQMFLGICKRRGFDPFAKQIYFRKYVTNRGPQVTIITSIDGYRLTAQRTREYEGQTAPQWCGEDGVWTDIWLSSKYPVAARVGVWRKGFREPTWGIAKWAEYFPSNEKEQFMWKKMPSSQLAKCAEALGLRKAFPEELSGIYTSDEMGQAEPRETAGAPVQRVVDAEVASTPAVAPAKKAAPKASDIPHEGRNATAAQLGALVELKKQVGGLTDHLFQQQLQAFRAPDGKTRITKPEHLSVKQMELLLDRYKAKIVHQHANLAESVESIGQVIGKAQAVSLQDAMQKTFVSDLEESEWCMEVFGVDSVKYLDKETSAAALQLVLAKAAGEETYKKALAEYRCES